MKVRNFTLFLLTCFLLFNSNPVFSQVELDFPEAPDDITVCEAPGQSYFSLFVTTDYEIDSLIISMPSGINYVPGSIQSTSGTDLTLAELDISNLSRPTFVLNRTELEPSDNIEFTISKTGDCGAIQFAQGENLAYDTLGVWSGEIVLEEVSSNYNIEYASLVTQYVHSKDTIVHDLPSMVCRPIRILNGGFGYISKIEHRVSPGSDLLNYELRYNNTPLTPTVVGGELIYEIDLADELFAGTFGDEDTILTNGDSIILEECFIVNNCNFSDGTVTHQTLWGCGGQTCPSPQAIVGSVGLDFSQPVLSSDIDSLDNVVCMDGQDKGFIRMRVWNTGIGPSVLNQIFLNANGSNTALDITDFKVINDEGEDLTDYFPNIQSSGSSSCGSGITSHTAANNDFESSYQLHPEDTIFIEMSYVMCCQDPNICGPYTLSNPYIRVRGTDLCGGNTQFEEGHAGTGGMASASDPIVTGNSVVSGNQVYEYCVEYPNYQFLKVGNADSSYVTFTVELPTGGGLSFGSLMNSNFSIGGNTIPIAETTTIGDILYIHVLLSDVMFQPAAPIKVCFELMTNCADGVDGLTSLRLGQSTNINCDPLCLLNLNCSEYDILLLGCMPGECGEEGGGVINSYSVERISYGYVDSEDNRDWDDFVRANPENLNLKRAMIGDTIRHQSELGFSAGSTTDWAGGYYRETHVFGMDEFFCPDTAWIEIIQGANMYEIGGLEPVLISNGFEYDLTVEALTMLPGGENLPDDFIFSPTDQINLVTQYAFCKEKSEDWYSVVPGTYRPMSERQEEIFTGSFAAVPADEENVEYACNEMYDEMLFLGAALSVEIKNGGFSGNGCDRDFLYLIEIKQNIGGVLSGYTGTYDFFPNEFRPLYIPDSIVVAKPNDVNFRHAWLVTQQISTGMTQEQLAQYIPTSQIIETETDVILKVRDVHDAFGGSLFPYEEENVDLRYYVAFRRSCESPLTVTTDLSIAYTSPICPADEFETIENSLTTGSNTNLGNIDYNQLPPVGNANNNATNFQLQIRPQGGTLSYTWLQLPENDSVTILSVSENGVIIPRNTNGIYELGTHNGNSTRTIIFSVELNSCISGVFEVLHGWSCYEYPDGEDDENCTYETLSYTINPVDSELQFNLVAQPSINNPDNMANFCSTVYYEMIVNSANAGSVINPRIDITLPSGFEISDVLVEYPIGVMNRESIFAQTTTTGNILSVDLTAHSMLVDSLPGTGTNPSPTNRQVKLRLEGHTSCDFRSGSQLFFTSFGERPCGGPVIGNRIRRASDRLYIDGLQPYQTNPTVELGVDQGVTCAIATPVNVVYQIEGGDFTGLDSGVLILSPGLEYLPGSLVCNTASSAACPTVDRIEPDPLNPGGTLVYFAYGGEEVLEGETIDFTFEVMAQEDTECGQMVNIQVENFVTVEGLMCGETVCLEGVSGITGVDTLEIEVIHPILTFDNLSAITISESDFLEYTGTVTVSQRALSEHDSLFVIIHCADMNGEAAEVVDSILIHGPVAINGSIDFTGYIPQMDCDPANGLVFTVQPIEGCLCSEPLQFLPGTEIMEEVREFDLALIKTVDQPADLKYGDTLVFDIQIFNQGDVWADSFLINDYIPDGLVFLESNNDLGWNLEPSTNIAKRMVQGPLLPGQDTTIQISLRLEYSTETDAYLNIAEIGEHHNPADLDDRDSTPDDDPSNDAGGSPESPSDDVVDGDGTGEPGDENPDTDEDDHDPALVKVADLALRKVWDEGYPGTVTYGDTLSMLIQIFNQGNVPTSYIEVTDYLPAGFSFIDSEEINPNWDGSDPSNPVYTWTGDTLYHGEMTEIRIAVVLEMVSAPDSSSWTNYSEISHFRDTTGMELQDVDSTPDNDPNNDAGGQPDSDADDYIDGDGTGDFGDGVAETDEDDHDPLRLQVYDLALRKVVSTNNTLPFQYDDVAIFDITVFNQGNEPVQNIEVTDYVPTNTEFDNGNAVNNGWDGTDPDNPVFTIAGPLAPGADTTISIALILRQETGVNNWVNYAEISSFEDLDGGHPDDIDSTPDNDPTNDYGAQPLGDTDNEIDGNAKASGTRDGVDDPRYDEDDHDVAILDVVDLALIKVIDTLNSDFPLHFGSLIKFDIIIQNQGNVITDSVRVADYVPEGYDFDPTLPQNVSQGWKADGTVMLTNQLDFLEYDTVSIYLTLQPVAVPMMDSWINYAEILEVYDTTGNEVGELDYDSTPGSDSEAERSVRPGDDGDDDFDSPHRDSIGSEDDHDPAGVMFLDLALYKQVDSTETNFPVRYGDLIRFNIHVVNQEGIMVDSVRVKDYVPEGYTFDPTLPENVAYGWRSDTTAIIEGPVNVGDTVLTAIYLELNPISVPTDRTWVNYSEIVEAWNSGMEIGDMDIDSSPGSDSPEERETYPGHPGDDDIMSISRDSIGSEDDHDPAHVEVFDLALIKTTEVEVGYPDLDVEFEITIFNQGGIPATNIEITDYVPSGYTFNSALNPGWDGGDPLVTYLVADTLYPGETIQVPIVLTVTTVLHPDSLINVAEISAAQDTTGADREDIDGVFDQIKDNDAGGQPDSPADNYVDGDGTGSPGDGVAATDEDNSDPAKILPCLPVNCHAVINMGFGTDCEIEITADMLLRDNRIAVAAPEFYEVELFYGPGIRIPDNILRPEHVGKPITARVTFLIDACGGGTCETSIVLDKPNACLIQNTLDTTVYCIDPFLALDPMDPAYPKPELLNICSDAPLTLEVSPDWVMAVKCDETSDTAKIILREWTAVTPGGERCTGVDTIVVLRLPKLTPAAFVDSADQTFYCDLHTHNQDGGLLTRYVSWKQPVGLHDYELPYTKLRGVIYEIPGTIILAGLANASDQGPDVLSKYLQTAILRKANGVDSVTIGQIVSGTYMDQLVANANQEQKRYGFLAALIEANDNLVSFLYNSVTFYPYLLLEQGDWILSENGNFEEVTTEWFYSGNGVPPFWFAGGWPSVYGSGDAVSYCDVSQDGEYGCIRIQVPRVIHGVGFDLENCDTICLTAGGTHCGISIDQQDAGWSGSCPRVRILETTVTQTCWAETASNCGTGESDLVTSYDSTAKQVEIRLTQTQTRIDTIGPIFDFEYSAEWDHDVIRDQIRAGEMPNDALEWERSYPTVYQVNSHSCEAMVFVPDVQVIDNCSGVYSVKAMIDVPGGTRAVEMIRTGVQLKLLSNGDTCYVYTYSHMVNPITVPFTGCDDQLIEVRYEAADQCWNQSEWVKYINIVDETPPTVVADHGVNVTLSGKTKWVTAETFDEGSWDNCSVELVLTRRSDWLECIDICNANERQYNSWIDILVDLGIRRSHAQGAINGDFQDPDAVNSAIDIDRIAQFLNEGEVEEYFFKQLVWLWEDDHNCGPKVVHAWIFALASALADQCGAPDEHGNTLKANQLEFIFDNLFAAGGYGNELALMGGGWAQMAPFKCEDACERVPVELLVMDYCCNWGIGGGDALVEDRGSTRIQKPLAGLDIDCQAYNSFYKEIVDAAAALGEQGSLADTAGLFEALDEAWGGYVITWVNNQGQPTDLEGNLLTDAELSFDLRNIRCEEKSHEEKIAVTNHDGITEWVSRITKTTFLDTIIRTGQHGIVSANCVASVVQDIWVDLDDCGFGTITRRFYITSGCGDNPQQLEATQVINIGSTCDVRVSMFDLPENVGSFGAPICIAESLISNSNNGYLTAENLPDGIGAMTLKPHLQGSWCSALAFGTFVKEFDIEGSSDLKKYLITWSAKDWCRANGDFEYVQEVIARIDPTCATTDPDTAASSLVSGRIQTALNSPLEGVEVKAILGNESPLTLSTTAEGEFEFEVKNGSQMSIVPGKNTGFSEGITTADLIDIQRHILQKSRLENHYQRMAADVNGNGLIDGLDVIELRKIILNPTRQFANSTSWRFFESTTGKEVYEIGEIRDDQEVNFIGTKIGDVNMSSDPATNNRSATGRLKLNVDDQRFVGGEIYHIDVRSENFESISGLQFTLQYSNAHIEVQSIQPGVLNVVDENYLHYRPGTLEGIPTHTGLVTASWSEGTDVTASPEDVLFTIVVKARNETHLRDVISLNHRVTRSEAYQVSGALYDVALEFGSSRSMEEGFALYQNRPNPYKGETVIGFNLPEATTATMTIYNVTGKLIKRIEGDFNAGYNEVRVSSLELGTTGVLYYQLDTDRYTATKKMIVVE